VKVAPTSPTEVDYMAIGSKLHSHACGDSNEVHME
jgi:hypothetical protein